MAGKYKYKYDITHPFPEILILFYFLHPLAADQTAIEDIFPFGQTSKDISQDVRLT